MLKLKALLTARASVLVASLALMIAFGVGSVTQVSAHSIKPLYVTCSQEDTALLTSRSTSDSVGYILTAYVYGKVDHVNHSIYCGPLWGQASIYEPAGRTGGDLSATLFYDGHTTVKDINPTGNGGTGGNTYFATTANEAPMCAYTGAHFHSQAGQELNVSTNTWCEA